ncbi:MAG: DNA glycosylase [Eubacteriales bacterium]
MEITEIKGNLVITDVNCFNLDLTLDCGQAFRWRKTTAGRWHGVAFGKVMEISQNDEGITLWNVTPGEFYAVWRGYFDLDREYELLCEGFCTDKTLKSAIELFPGIRVLRQEPWETLCSFIISQNNNIPRIKGVVDRLCTNFGEDLGAGDYTFPSAEKIFQLGIDDLAPIRAGFRSKYILDAAQKVASGEVRLAELADKTIEEARLDLIRIKGVGSKVAECTLLYGCGQAEAFPVDVWVKRVMEELYPNGLPECVMGFQGIAQQYLFHWRRQQ